MRKKEALFNADPGCLSPGWGWMSNFRAKRASRCPTSWRKSNPIQTSSTIGSFFTWASIEVRLWGNR